MKVKKVTAAFAAASILFASPIMSSAALGDRVLKEGMTHTEVKELQTVLKTKGYFYGNTTTYFGSITKKAVVNFQKKSGLKADGIVGAGTYKALGISKKSAASAYNSTKLVNVAKKYMNVPYVWGGNTPSGFDCSGYLKYVFQESIGVSIPRTVAEIYTKGTKVSQPQIGDLVFFETYKSGASHAGIYIGNNEFIHSSSSKGVGISSMKNSYWAARYLGAKRITAN